MSERANHIYTQLLIISVLAFVTKDAPWWTILVIIVACSALAFVTDLIKDKRKGE